MLSPAPKIIEPLVVPPFVSFNTYNLALTLQDAQFMRAPAVAA